MRHSRGSRHRCPSRHVTPLIVATVFAALSGLTAAARCDGYTSADPPDESIEWMVADSDLVARCRLGPDADDGHESDRDWWRYDFHVVETLKGPALDAVRVRVHGLEDAAYHLSEWRSHGGERLVFFRRSGAVVAERDAGMRGRDKYPYALRPRHCLIPHAEGPSAGAVLAVGMDFRAYRSLEDVCAAARAAVVAERTAGRPSHFATHGESERAAMEVVADGRAGFVRRAPDAFEGGAEIADLFVPLDSRLDDLAGQWAAHPDPHVRWIAFDVARCFKSPRNAGIVRRYLADRSYKVPCPHGKSTTWTYDLRRQAHETLQAWGEDVPDLVFVEPHYRPIGRVLVVGGSCAAGAAMLWFGALGRHRFRRAAADLATRPAWGSLLRAWTVGLTTVLAAFVALAAGTLWHRSRTIVDEVTFGTRDARHWVSAFCGDLQVVRIDGWPDRPPVGYGTFRLDEVPNSLWAGDAVTKPAVSRLAGLRRTSGQTYDADGEDRPYHAWHVPLGSVAAAFAAVPAARLAGAALRSARRRGHRRAGRCTSCGYDLRGGHGRCPECGSVTSMNPGPLPA